jgi:hypothetical protein
MDKGTSATFDCRTASGVCTGAETERWSAGTVTLSPSVGGASTIVYYHQYKPTFQADANGFASFPSGVTVSITGNNISSQITVCTITLGGLSTGNCVGWADASTVTYPSTFTSLGTTFTFFQKTISGATDTANSFTPGSASLVDAQYGTVKPTVGTATWSINTTTTLFNQNSTFNGTFIIYPSAFLTLNGTTLTVKTYQNNGGNVSLVNGSRLVINASIQ